MRGRAQFERDHDTFTADAVRCRGFEGCAVRILGWEVEPDEDTEWSGILARTGRIVVVMVGDDARHVVDFEDVSALPRADYCGECGQIGCGHDGLDRDEEEGQ